MLSAKQYAERKRKRQEEDLHPELQSSQDRPHIAQVTSRSALGVATTSMYINNTARIAPRKIPEIIADAREVPTKGEQQSQYSEVRNLQYFCYIF